MSLTEQTRVLANYLPSGRVWASKNVDGTTTHSLLEGLAGEMLRSVALVEELRDEVLPDGDLFLVEWETALAIPDDCFTGAGTVATRKRDVLAKLASMGVQTADDMIALAALFGITAVIEAGSVRGVFPFTFPMIFYPDALTAFHTIVVDLGSPTVPTFPYTFPLTFGSGELALVQCLLAKVKPANVQLLFMELP